MAMTFQITKLSKTFFCAWDKKQAQFDLHMCGQVWLQLHALKEWTTYRRGGFKENLWYTIFLTKLKQVLEEYLGAI